MDAAVREEAQALLSQLQSELSDDETHERETRARLHDHGISNSQPANTRLRADEILRLRNDAFRFALRRCCVPVRCIGGS